MFGKITQLPPLSNAARADHCANGCGLCKSLGREYGFTSRLLLNSDLIVLQELLSAVEGERDAASAAAPALTHKCFDLPADPPLRYRYSAAVTLLLADYKLADDASDGRGLSRLRARVQRSMLADRVERARGFLHEQGFALQAFDLQARHAVQLEGAAASMEDLAEAYGALSALVARHGVEVLGMAHLAGDAARLGDTFGRIIYVADAIQDLERDRAAGAFNPLLSADHDSASNRQYAADYLASQLAELQRIAAPHANARLAAIIDRIRFNIERSVHAASALDPDWRQAWRDKWASFRGQVRMHDSLVDQGIGRLGVLRQRSSIVLYSLVAVFLLGCYESSVPLDNRIDPLPGLIGHWKGCEGQDREKSVDMQIRRVNDQELEWVTFQTTDGVRKEKEKMRFFLSRVNGRVFMNLTETRKDPQERKYVFLEIELSGDEFSYRLVDDKLFKEGKKTRQFQRPEDLSAYFRTVMDKQGFHSLDKKGKPKEVSMCKLK